MHTMPSFFFFFHYPSDCPINSCWSMFQHFIKVAYFLFYSDIMRFQEIKSDRKNVRPEFTRQFEFPMKAATYRSNGGIMSKVFVFGYARPFLCDLRPMPPAIGYPSSNAGLSEPHGAVGACSPQFLADQFTLSPSRGIDNMLTNSVLGPLNFRPSYGPSMPMQYYLTEQMSKVLKLLQFQAKMKTI